ncbi:divergent polysaccharide deacetylase family protein [Thioclava atlantica]|uniref:YibQ protein n=1 Tax=Thioclava atlantica TaxID=1317124 RepID=A0A085TS57_9RHOB|nr:divergent polysaccharide deacetylase family protein [Thioclava atlantica]KFE33554.1 YibQ protein [Thioclava atlantica]
MFGSVIRGGLAGIVVAVLTIAGLSLVLPRPKEPGEQFEEGLVAYAPKPQSDTVMVPAGSDFTRAATDRAPRMPAPAGAPLTAPTAPPSAPLSQPSLAPPPQIADTQPAARPEAAPETPEPQPNPEGEVAALEAPVTPEQPIPVPPPGDVNVPALGPAAAPSKAPSIPEAPQPPAGAPTLPVSPEAGPLVDAGIGREAALQTGEGASGPVTLSGAGMKAHRVPETQPDAASPDRSAAMPALPEAAPLTPDFAAPAPEMAPPASEPDMAPDATPDLTPQKPRVLTLDPAPSLPGKSIGGFKSAPGVIVDRLPQVGAAPPTDAAPGATPADVAPPSAPDTRAMTPLERFAAPVVPDPTKARVSIVLIDPGIAAGALDPDTITSLGLPMTIAIDPTRPGAAEDGQAFREAGYEIAILAADLPENATPADVEVALEAWRHTLPEAVAVVERRKPEFQNNRPLARQMVSALARDGLGLVTQKVGFDSANQIAASSGLPHTQIWRVLDAGREKAPAISRMLSRAGFEADREGQVAVMLSAWPETISGIDDWYVAEQSRFALVPVSSLVLSSVPAAGQ